MEKLPSEPTVYDMPLHIKDDIVSQKLSTLKVVNPKDDPQKQALIWKTLGLWQSQSVKDCLYLISE